jgi:hypothetical protein
MWGNGQFEIVPQSHVRAMPLWAPIYSHLHNCSIVLCGRWDGHRQAHVVDMDFFYHSRESGNPFLARVPPKNMSWRWTSMNDVHTARRSRNQMSCHCEERRVTDPSDEAISASRRDCFAWACGPSLAMTVCQKSRRKIKISNVSSIEKQPKKKRGCQAKVSI